MRIAEVISVNKNRKTSSEEKIELFYSHLFDSLIDGVCVVDEYGYFEYINSSYERIFSTDEPTCINKSIFLNKNDDIILTAFREKRIVRGKLNFDKGINMIVASASPLNVENEFKGVIAFYKELELTEKKANKKNKKNISKGNDYNTGILNDSFKDIIGESEILKKALIRAQKSSKTSATVLIRGESGTGKELVAKAIHKSSIRSKGAFVAVNCGGIPSTLIESELFGHEKGSFTGATNKKIGKFELANNGTIFLDEIGDLPLEMQVKLLRVLQEKEFERIGGTETIKPNIRIIAATNKNLEDMIDGGKFREDLYYRLNVIPIYLPSLKERREDIPLLIDFFIDKISKKFGKNNIKLTDKAKQCLYYYDWNGNVRELENIIERLIALADEEVIGVNDLPNTVSDNYFVNNKNNNSSLINMNSNGALATLEEYEREIIKHAIQKFGSFNAAGKALGVTHKTVAFKARKYEIVD